VGLALRHEDSIAIGQEKSLRSSRTQLLPAAAMPFQLCTPTMTAFIISNVCPAHATEFSVVIAVPNGTGKEDAAPATIICTRSLLSLLHLGQD
jgi:hypothetical protein